MRCKAPHKTKINTTLIEDELRKNELYLAVALKNNERILALKDRYKPEREIDSLGYDTLQTIRLKNIYLQLDGVISYHNDALWQMRSTLKEAQGWYKDPKNIYLGSAEYDWQDIQKRFANAQTQEQKADSFSHEWKKRILYFYNPSENSNIDSSQNNLINDR